MARLIRFALVWLLLAALAGAAYFWVSDYVRRHPQDVPWTEFDLEDPVGVFTSMKLARLSDDPRRCYAILRDAGVPAAAVPPRSVRGSICGYRDGVAFGAGSRFEPDRLVTACPVAAALWKWQRDTLDPTAMRKFGRPLARIEHYGSFECRRVGHRPTGRMSEHATADAVDISGFVLADGTRISVRQGWKGDSPQREFLRDARDGACALFATTLTPDYDAAHFDHFHLDQAPRGKFGAGLCR